MPLVKGASSVPLASLQWSSNCEAGLEASLPAGPSAASLHARCPPGPNHHRGPKHASLHVIGIQPPFPADAIFQQFPNISTVIRTIKAAPSRRENQLWIAGMHHYIMYVRLYKPCGWRPKGRYPVTSFCQIPALPAVIREEYPAYLHRCIYPFSIKRESAHAASLWRIRQHPLVLVAQSGHLFFFRPAYPSVMRDEQICWLCA